MRFQTKLLAAAALSAAVFAQPASAALSVSDIYTGTYGLSTDGGGSNSASYTISAFVPAGATVTAAYLYQSTYSGTTYGGITLDGNALTFGAASINSAATYLASSRADVTSFLAPVINGGVGGTYNFTVDEGANTGAIDGTALVVVYSLPSLATSTVAILDGFSATTGDTTTLSFSSPLNPLAPGFTAEMRLGIGFSCCSQQSTVTVNGTVITNTAGNNDDGVGGTNNGQLITVGGDDDAFSALLPAYGDDHERYDLTPYINVGDTAITVDTINPSNNDNIFLAAFRVSGNAVVNAVPEPGTWSMMIAGFGMVGAFMRRRVRKLAALVA
jgi:PEP-CTERM motif